MLRQVKFRDYMHVTVRVDIPHPLAGNVNLPPAQCGVQGVELAVEVRYRYRIMVNQRQLPNSGAGKRLHRKGAHTAQAKHDYMALSQPLNGRLPKEHPLARKGIRHIHPPPGFNYRFILA